MSPVLSVDELRTLLTAERSDRRRIRLLDVRWRLDIPEGRPAYLSGHLPGAVYVDLEHELSRPGHPDEGRHPLPSVDELEHAARRWGIDDDDLVVAYDDNDGVAAARAWWLLRSGGVDVRVLDGGLRAWVRAGNLLEHGDVAPRRGQVTLRRRDDDRIGIDEAARLPATGVLLDARSPKYYRGTPHPLDPVAGHIPGAVNLPTVTHIDPDGRLRSPDAVRRAASDAGIRPDTDVAVYGSSGIDATHTVLALATAGIDARLFPGSWSAWVRSPGRAVAIGATPTGQVFAV